MVWINDPFRLAGELIAVFEERTLPWIALASEFRVLNARKLFLDSLLPKQSDLVRFRFGTVHVVL